MKLQVLVGSAGETRAEVLGVHLGKVMAMEGVEELQVRVLFYVLRKGGNI